MLNVTFIKIHSIILSVTCHGLRNFHLLIHIPSYPFMNFWNPIKLLFFELESLIKCWMWIGIKIHSIILSVTCHGLRNYPLVIPIPFISICEFLKPYKLLFFWVRVTHKMLKVNWEKIHSIILSVNRGGWGGSQGESVMGNSNLTTFTWFSGKSLTNLHETWSN